MSPTPSTNAHNWPVGTALFILTPPPQPCPFLRPCDSTCWSTLNFVDNPSHAMAPPLHASLKPESGHATDCICDDPQFVGGFWSEQVSTTVYDGADGEHSRARLNLTMMGENQATIVVTPGELTASSCADESQG
ncbi:hypothetical protein HK101_002951 [Irineochytrium annulatum]|nr:hypothetical protein HK101_002951 [Irineochytrium annulatum]